MNGNCHRIISLTLIKASTCNHSGLKFPHENKSLVWKQLFPSQWRLKHRERHCDSATITERASVRKAGTANTEVVASAGRGKEGGERVGGGGGVPSGGVGGDREGGAFREGSTTHPLPVHFLSKWRSVRGHGFHTFRPRVIIPQWPWGKRAEKKVDGRTLLFFSFFSDD